MNKDVSIKSRLRLFQAVVTPAVLYGLSTVPLTSVQISELDRLQRKMLRSIVGWRRQPDEPWPTTMRRMNARITQALTCFHVEDWSKQLAKRQWALANRVATSSTSWPADAVRWQPLSQLDPLLADRPHRKQGRPKTRWDDYLTKFCQQQFPQISSWIDAASNTVLWLSKLESYIEFFHR